MAFGNANIDGYPPHRKAAPLFDLFKQPFYILGIDPAATDLEINNVYAAVRDGALVSEDSLVSAREAILNPAKRLSCELGYPLDSLPNEIAVLNDALRSVASTSEPLRIADKLAPLSSANFCAHIAARRPAEADLLSAIVVSHGAIDSTEIYAALKAFRAKAGWPAPSLLSVVQGLRELLDLHAEAALRGYHNIEDCAEPVLACTQAILTLNERFHIEALARFLTAYRKSIDMKRSRAATLIKNASDALQQRPEEVRLVAVLSDTLEFWGLLCGPLILFNAHQDRSDDEDPHGLAECVSLLVDDLTRHQQYTVARQIAELGRDLLGSARDRFDEQLRRINHLASGGPIKPLRDLTGKLEVDPSLLIHALEQGGFGPHSGEPVGRLWVAFVQSVRTPNRADLTEPWSLLRDLAMRLNRGGHYSAASALIRGLIQQGQAITAPREILAMLPYDLSLIEGGKQAQPAEGGFLPPSEPAVQPIQKLRESPLSASERPARKRNLLKGLFLAAAALVLVAAALAGADFYFGFSQIAALRWPPVSNRADLEGAAAPEAEIIPPVGTGQSYSLPFVRYCHFQAERLKTIKQLAQGPEDARAYNLLVVDYNARCSDFLYQSQDLMSVVAEVSANKSSIEADARRIVSTWPGHATERK